MNLLLIDNDDFFSNQISTAIQSKELSVLKANSTNEALSILYKTKIDLILSNVLLPGIQIASLVCSLKGRYPKTPLLLLSGSEPDYNVKIALMLGADALLPKTLSINQLYSTISRYTA